MMDERQENEQRLIGAWRAGDTSAGQQLIEHHYESVFVFFSSRVPPEAAGDLTQQTFETMCERLDTFRGDSSLRTFLFAIARFELMNHLRRSKKHAERHAPSGESYEVAATDPSLATLVDARRRANLLVKALRSLEVDDQLIIELREYEELSNDDLAKIFDVPRGTVASRLRRARERLKSAVERLAKSPQDVTDTLTNLVEYMRRVRDDRATGSA